MNYQTTFDLAEDFIRHTSRPIFLTGKAGTGKTTFLRHIQKTTNKKTVVVAPTGVAAIQCAGTTIHSFFQLPFRPFVPGLQLHVNSDDLSDHYSLLKDLKYDADKRDLLRALELLIIDEISMVRCDVLDAIDTILRHFRRKAHTAFGGVQVLFIGDLFQLPPVVQDHEWNLLQHYYDGPFFFQAKVMERSRPLYIELDKIFRQQNLQFIGVLNRIRDNTFTSDDLDTLNRRYNPSFEAPVNIPYITLTTHNSKADAINTAALERLPGPLYRFEGVVEGDFPERSFPTEKVLALKERAQVMFIKNDMEKVRRYYNGLVGVVRAVSDDKIVVGFHDNDQELEVEKETWKNIRYTYNPATRQIEEEVLGTFQQYAVRLAWAITIHKSQGLTFRHAVIDAGGSFAAGQVYVALSRCTSLEGIVLRSRIAGNRVLTDERVVQFAASATPVDGLQSMLAVERRRYAFERIVDKFDWNLLVDALTTFEEALRKRKFREKASVADLSARLVQSAGHDNIVARRFQAQLQRLFAESERNSDIGALAERLEKGRAYFDGRLAELTDALLQHQSAVAQKPRLKAHRKDVRAVIEFIAAFRASMHQVDLRGIEG